MRTYIPKPFEVKFRTRAIDRVTMSMWREFYNQLAARPKLRCDFVLCWTPGQIGYDFFTIFPFCSDDDGYAEPQPFGISANVTDYERRLEALEEQDEDSTELWTEFCDWAADSVVASWKRPSIQRLHSKLIDWKFGLYTCGYHEIDRFEFDDCLIHVGGDKLKRLTSP